MNIERNGERFELYNNSEAAEEMQMSLSHLIDRSGGYIYALISTTMNRKSVVKVGYASDLPTRMSGYPPTMMLFDLWAFSNAKEVEAYIHKTYKSLIRDEWYDWATFELISKHLEELTKIEMDKQDPDHYRLYGKVSFIFDRSYL